MFTKVLGTKVLLFLVFGLLMGAVVAANVVLAYRFRPLFRPAVAGAGQPRPLPRGGRPAAPLAGDRRRRSCSGLFAGGSGSGQWRQFLLWRHRAPFGTSDPYFHKDVGFYVFELPVAALPGRLRRWR